MKRRKFIKNSALGMVGAGVLASDTIRKEKENKQDKGPKIKEYRTLGRTGFKVSDISAGLPGNEAILNRLLDAGVNYIDSAEYYSQGFYERMTGNVIKNRNRKSLFITTKLALKGKESKESIIQRTRKCLERLQTDYLDCMMISSAETVQMLKYPAFHEAMKQLKNEGRVRFVGVSNHGSSFPGMGQKRESMEKILVTAARDGRFDILLLVYNFLTKEASEKILKVCAEKNIGTTLMKVNPVGDYHNVSSMIKQMEAGGKPVPKFYQVIQKKFKEEADRMMAHLKKEEFKDPAKIREAAIRFVLSNPGVHAVLCACNTFDQVESFIKLSGMPLTATDKSTLADYEKDFGRLYCRHACGLCEYKCPHQVPVNTIMRFNHYFTAQGREKHAMNEYSQLEGNRADVCSNCSGDCESACPYKVPIQPLLILAHQNLHFA